MVKVTGGHNSRVPLAALIAIKPGCGPRLIHRVHRARPHGKDQRKGLTEAGYAALLDAAHQQLGGPLVLVWDNLNTHLSAAMAELITAPGLADRLPAAALCPRAEPSRAGLVAPQTVAGEPGQAEPAQLTALVKTRLRRMQYRPALLEGFLASTRLDLAPFCNPHP